MAGEQAMPRLVCFDWGGVILKHCRSWHEGCAAAGLPVHEQVLTPHHTTKRRALTQLFQRGQISEQDFFEQLTSVNDGLYTREELVRIHDAWLLSEYDGIDRVIDALVKTPGVETALLSNTNHAHWVRHIPGADGRPADFPTAGKLKHRHASHLFGMAKPDAEIYREFERHVDFAGSDVLFFDDLPENIATASTIGWRCVLVDHTGDTASQIAGALAEHNIHV
jgi:FMN phosphatase YigB (HAD superfamily)